MTPSHYFLWIFILCFGTYAFFTKANKNKLFIIFMFLSLIVLQLVFFGSNARGLVPEEQYSDAEVVIYNQGITDLYNIIKRETIHFIGISLIIFILCIRGFSQSKEKQTKTEP